MRAAIGNRLSSNVLVSPRAHKRNYTKPGKIDHRQRRCLTFGMFGVLGNAVAHDQRMGHEAGAFALSAPFERWPQAIEPAAACRRDTEADQLAAFHRNPQVIAHIAIIEQHGVTRQSLAP